MSRHIVIGDVHGCGQEFLALLDELCVPQPGDRVILTGDLFDRGPLPQVVLARILELRHDGTASVESVCGNHDEELLEYCRGLYSDATDLPGLSRVQSEAIRIIDEASMLEDLTLLLEELSDVAVIRGPAEIWAVVHAGIDPALGLEGTPQEVMRTIRSTTRAPAWYDEYDGRDGLIICGHEHQTEPLIRHRGGQPVVINVDTGCCYGGELTAYVVDEQRFVSVRAAKAYYHERP